MTWQEVKERIEKLGVQDEDEIDYIDFQGEPTCALGPGYPGGKWQIT